MTIKDKISQLARSNLNQVKDYGYIPALPVGNTIPKIIHQTYFSAKLPEAIQANVDSLRALNPDWEYRFYDDADIDAYVKKNYPNLFSTFKKLNPAYGAAMADFFRYLVMYKEGGVYLDIKSSMSKPLNEIVKPDDQYVLSYWKNDVGDEMENIGKYVDIPDPLGEFQQWYIITVAGHPFLKSVIETVSHNVENYNPFLNHGGHLGTFRVTGPIAYTLAILPLLNQYPHRFERSNHDIGLIYNIFAKVPTHNHHFLYKTHYSKLKQPLVTPSKWLAPLVHVFLPIRNFMINFVKTFTAK
jgi:mannosyltransferase OCH1-like enzyme